MGTRVAVMSPGRIEQVGTPREVYDTPASVFVARFVGMPAMNVVGPGRLDASGHRVGIRPEHLHLDPEGPLEAAVALVEHLGHEDLVTVNLEGGETLVVRHPRRDDVVSGDRVRVRWEEDRLHHFDAVSGRRVASPNATEVTT